MFAQNLTDSLDLTVWRLRCDGGVQGPDDDAAQVPRIRDPDQIRVYGSPWAAKRRPDRTGGDSQSRLANAWGTAEHCDVGTIEDLRNQFVAPNRAMWNWGHGGLDRGAQMPVWYGQRLETEPHPTHGHQMLRLAAPALDLLAQAVHRGVDRSRADAWSVSPHVAQELLARHHLPRPVRQVAEESSLERRELDGRAASPHQSPFQIDGGSAEAKSGPGHCDPVGETGQSIQAGPAPLCNKQWPTTRLIVASDHDLNRPTETAHQWSTPGP